MLTVNAEDLIDQMNLADRRLSKGHQRLARYLADHYDSAAHLTASALGEAAGVSESTVVRFAVAMGYEGYPEFQQAFQELVRHRLTANQRFQMSTEMKKEDVLATVLKANMRNIRSTVEHLDNSAFLDAVNRIQRAKAIYVLGLRSAAPLAQFLGYYLNFIFDNVHIVASGVTDVFEGIVRVDQDDVLIAISFPRYSNRTVEAMRFAKRSGAQVIALTDGAMSPLFETSDVCLAASTDMASFVDSLAAPLSVINALLVALGLQKGEALKNHLEQLEGLWTEHSVYTGQEHRG
ncbi:MAG: MurR/RpiR family transcriptional regulator [Clostridia bacterium]|nr:MurR/RpiR family transcriptional regulator [Clostridia bacterium]